MTGELYRLGPNDGERIALLHDHIQGDPALEQPEPDSWQPINLTTLPDQPPIRPTLGTTGLIYPGKRHVFSGPPESAKTLAAYTVAITVIRDGGTLILIDFEMGAYDARARLQELGATQEEIARIYYLEPDVPATTPRITQLVQLQPQLVLVDAAAGAYNLQGLDDNKRQDVEQLANLYIRTFWRAGIASIFIDHVVKNTEMRGKYSIGSERKLGAADVHIGFETITPIQRGKQGLYKLTTHKDRGGYLQRGHLANLALTSDEITHQIGWTYQPADPQGDTAAAGYFRPTHLMEKVSIYLELTPEPVTRNTICDAITGKRTGLLAAINALNAEGFTTETDGPGRTKLVTHSRRYRENNPENNPAVPLVPGGSPVVPEPDEMGGSRGSPPYRGNTGTPLIQEPPKQDEWFPPTWLDELAETVDLTKPAGTLDTEETQ